MVGKAFDELGQGQGANVLGTRIDNHRRRIGLIVEVERPIGIVNQLHVTYTTASRELWIQRGRNA